MAVASIAPAIHRRWPDLETALSARVDYDPDVDSLFVAFGQRRPAVNVPLETGKRDYVYLVVDLDTDEVVGVEVEDVRGRWPVIRHGRRWSPRRLRIPSRFLRTLGHPLPPSSPTS